MGASLVTCEICDDTRIDYIGRPCRLCSVSLTEASHEIELVGGALDGARIVVEAGRREYRTPRLLPPRAHLADVDALRPAIAIDVYRPEGDVDMLLGRWRLQP
jgi:hypothetical protein